LLNYFFLSRTDLAIIRQEFDDTKAGESRTIFKTFNFRCPVMNVFGDTSPHDDDAVETNGRLNPANSSLLKV
jgi:hypothetical protein